MATRDEVIRHYKIEADRIAVIPQGADDSFKPVEDPDVLRASRSRFFGGDRPYILFVGKGSPRRNIPMLVRAFAELRRGRRIPHGLVLFGPNTADFPLHDLCRELGIESDVVQTDGKVAYHSELVPIYGAADVFVHPSEFEGWSMTTVEALACGTAVIAADRGGLAEVARGHALMISDLSVETLADAIYRVLSDEPLRLDLRKRAREHGRALRWEATTRATLDVIRRVTAGVPIFGGSAIEHHDDLPRLQGWQPFHVPPAR
jgi:glycosyltransferase involved in cell wall biosynthesis